MKRDIFSSLIVLAVVLCFFTSVAWAIDWLKVEDIKDMPKTVIRYWYYETPELTELGEKEKAKFEQLYPNIKVDGRPAPPFVDNWELMSFILAGTNSHVHQSVNNETLWYIDHDLLLPLDVFPDFEKVLSKFDPNTTWKWKDGHYYALPWYGDTYLLGYNKKMVEAAGLDPSKPPIYYDEFFEWCDKLVVRDETGKIIKPALVIHSGEEWWRFIMQAYNPIIANTGSGDYISKDGTKATFNNPGWLEVYEFLSEGVKKGYFGVEPWDVNPWFSGDVAIDWQLSPWTLADVKRMAPPDFEFFAGPYPKSRNSTVEGNPTRLFVREFILIRERKLKGEAAQRTDRAAWEYMKFLLEDEQLANTYRVSGALPCVKDIDTNPLFTAITDTFHPVIKQLIEARKTAVNCDINSPKTTEVQSVLTQMTVKVLLGEDPKEALKWGEEEANKILSGEKVIY